MLNKSLMQFSAERWACAPSLLVVWPEATQFWSLQALCVSHSVVSDSANPQTIACQASLSMEFSRQEYWSGLPFPSPEPLPNPGIEPWSPASQADSLPFELQGRLYGTGSMVGLKVSFKRTHASTRLTVRLLPVPQSVRRATANTHLCRRPSDTHRQV